MAIEAMKKAYATDPVREMLESRHKAELAENTRLNVALKKGRVEGKVEGKVETAQKLRELGSTAELIEAATGLKPGDY